MDWLGQQWKPAVELQPFQHRNKNFVSRKKKAMSHSFFTKLATAQALQEVCFPCERRAVSPSHLAHEAAENLFSREPRKPLISLFDYVQVCTVCLHTQPVVNLCRTYTHSIGCSVFQLTHWRATRSCSHVCLCSEKTAPYLPEAQATQCWPNRPSPSFIEFQTRSMLPGNCTVNQCLSKPRQ